MILSAWRIVFGAFLPLVASVARGSDVPPRLSGVPLIQAWTDESYHAAAVNWDIVQHPRTGFVYAANNYGVLEYDGATWRLIELPNEGRVRALAIDAHGAVWVGGDDLGVLAPDERGALRVVSQAARLPENMRGAGSFAFLAAATDGIVAATTTKITHLPFAPNAPAQAWSPSANVATLWSFDSALHASLVDGSVVRITAAGLEPVALQWFAGEVTSSRRIFAVRPLVAGAWLVLSNDGPARWRGPGTPLEPFHAHGAIFGDNQATNACFLSDGRGAFATVNGGLLIFGADGRLEQQVQREQGLPGNRVDALWADQREGGVWLALRSGIARVQLDSPFAIHGATQGLTGGARALQRHGGRLYVGHNEGLAWRDASGIFQPIRLPLGSSRLLSHAGRLFATTGALREVLPDGRTVRLARQPFTPITGWQADPAVLFGAAATGLWIDRLTSAGVDEVGRVAAAPSSLAHLLDSGDGFLWGIAADGGVTRVDFRAGVKPDAPVRRYGPAEGVPAARRRDEPVLLQLGGSVVASSAAWLRRYDVATDRFVAEERIEGLPAGREGGFTDVSRAADGSWWGRTGPPRRLLHLVPAGPHHWQAQGIADGPLANLVSNAIYADDDARTLWVAGQGPLVSIDLAWRSVAEPPPLQAVVRRLETTAGELLWADGGDRTRPVPLRPQQNAFTVFFTAPTFAPDCRGEVTTLYRTRLDGLDPDWTPWSAAAHRAFTNLPYRAHTFRVQARDLAGRTSADAVLAWVIAPPWWLARWAFAAYAVGVGLGVAGFVRLRTHGLRRRAAQLETVVAERTVELERLRQLEIDEKLAARLDEEKARLEVLRYQLNPHFLYNALNSIRALVFAQPGAAGDMVGQLAEFCRTTLTRSDDPGPVAEEFAMLGLYLDMEKTRWGDRLAVEIELDPAAATRRIPPFLLLPLLENALKHGRQEVEGVLRLRLVARVEPGGLVLEVANTGEWVDAGRSLAQSSSIGLENLRQRLRRHFPGAHELATVSQDGWVVVRLRIFHGRLPAVPAPGRLA